MLLKIARFEIRYLLRHPLLWGTAGLTFVGFAASTSAPGFELGSEGGLVRNASYALLRNLTMLSLMYMTILTAFVCNALLRDDDTGYGPIIRATPITRTEYLLGRFFGAFAVVAGCIMVGAVALWVGTLLPWSDSVPLGPNRLAPLLYGVFLIALPNLFVGGAVLFMIAAITRSALGTYLGVIAFASAFFFVSDSLDGQSSFQTALTLGDPFGIRAVEDAVRYWTVAQRNVMLPEFSGLLLANRLLWLSVGVGLLALAVARYRYAERGQTARERRKQELVAAADAEAMTGSLPGALALPSPAGERQGFGALLWLRTRFEAWQVVSSPAFPILMAWGVFTTLISLTTQRDPEGRPTYPTTLSLIPELEGGLEVMPLLVAVYFAGELVWRERDRRIHEIIDATPMPSWAYVMPKTIALSIVLLGIMLAGVLSAITLQLSLGFTELELGKYLLWFVLPSTWDLILLAAAAVFVQALSPHKVVGWVILFGFAFVHEFFKPVNHNLLVYGGHPDVPLSDLAQAGSFWVGAWTYRLYWAAFAVLLLVGAHVLWRRGVDVRLMPRLRRARQSLRGAPALVAGLAALVLAASGGVAYYNTNVLGGYQSVDDQIAHVVAYERKYAQYLDAPQPVISKFTMEVALFPEERRAEVSGTYRMRNDTQEPIRDVHVRMFDDELSLIEASVEGGALVEDDSVFRHRIYRLAQPMAPGEERALTFRTQRWVRGYRNSWPETRLIENGTFLYAEQLGPIVGLIGEGRLEDPEEREKHGLPELPGLPALGDSAAIHRTTVGLAWATSDVTVSTTADQTPLSAGNRVSDVTEGGRRTARFVSDVPVRARLVVLSARYAERTRQHKGVELAVYYHARHGWNVERMLDAAAKSLDYYQASFGPYQFDHFRIVELPGYYGFAQAFAGTIPYSEMVGFIADINAAETIDQVSGMTSHELAHQWWAHQVAGAFMEGEGVLSETMAQYGAHMMVKRLNGEAQVRRYLKFELDWYLAARNDDDPPLIRARGEQHLLYRKGALVMYLLQERLGEEAVNRALRSLVDRFRFKGAPYATTLDLVAALRAEATTEEQQSLITDLFERVTLYDLAVVEPTAVQRADGKWDVTVPVLAKKIYADTTGNEAEAPLAEAIEVGLFMEEPGRDAFAAKHVIVMERRMLRSGRQEITFVSDRKPLYAGVDPYHFYIDRRSGDNVGAVK